jgi:hypothetical protein
MSALDPRPGSRARPGTPPFTSTRADTDGRAFYKPRRPLPEPVLPTETGALTEPGRVTETSDPRLPEPLPAGSSLRVV